MKAATGTQARRRERSGCGRMPAFSRSHRQKSWRATRWQAQPQNQRPKTAVARAAAAKKISPALTTPSRARAIASDGSTGVIVRPAISQWATWAATTRWIAISTPARHLPAREGRMVVGRSRGRSWRTVRGTDPGYSYRPRPVELLHQVVEGCLRLGRRLRRRADGRRPWRRSGRGDPDGHPGRRCRWPAVPRRAAAAGP